MFPKQGKKDPRQTQEDDLDYILTDTDSNSNKKYIVQEEVESQAQ